MIKLGVNSLMFCEYDFATAAKCIAEVGYDGVEIAAIKSMCEHLDLDCWKKQAKDLARIVRENGLEILSIEEARPDEELAMRALEAAAEMSIPVVNIGSGGKADVPGDFDRSVKLLRRVSERAQQLGVSLCVKAHVGSAICDTPTTLRAMKAIDSPAFGVDMDPSHIHRAGENAEEALQKVVHRVKHIHIRDCKGRQRDPGPIRNQACGKGNIDLTAFCREIVQGDYSGPVCLEVHGKDEGLDLAALSVIAAESYGFLNACFRFLGVR